MRFSIGIPAYESEYTLERALNSVAAQNFNDIEIIVSDDCSQKSNLKKICNNFKIKNPKILLRYYFQKKNLGPTPNIKFLLEKANSDERTTIEFKWSSAEKIISGFFIIKYLVRGNNMPSTLNLLKNLTFKFRIFSIFLYFLHP